MGWVGAEKTAEYNRNRLTAMPSICIISPVNKPFTTARAAQTLHETGDAVFRDGSHGLQSFKSIVGRLTSDALERQDAQ